MERPMKTDILQLSRKELQELITKAQKLLVQKESEEKEALRVKIEAEVSAAGFTVADVLGGVAPTAEKPVKVKKGRKLVGSSVPPKYRNPANRLETWSGRGRKPAWVNSHTAGGGTLEECRIADDAGEAAA